MGSGYTKPTFEKFAEMLITEYDILVGMGILKSSKSKALVANEGNSSGKNSNNKQKQWKDKPQADTQQSTKPQSSSNKSSSTQQRGKSSSKDNQKGNNFKEKKTCSYCKKNGHEEIGRASCRERV